MSEHKSQAHGTQSHGTQSHATGQEMDHEYDGIKEYDNPLPRWWVWIFWATIVFAVGYAFHYHWSGHGQGRVAVLDEETRIAGELAMKLAAKEKVTEESLAKLTHNSASVSAGAALFVARCQSCHAEKGKGLIGPNLTDAYWLHGKGQLMDIYSTVSEGVLAKGMPAWSKQLSPIELRSVVAYVGTLRGLGLPGKAPQGELASGAQVPDGEPKAAPAGSNPGDGPSAPSPAASASAPAPASSAGTGPVSSSSAAGASASAAGSSGATPPAASAKPAPAVGTP